MRRIARATITLWLVGCWALSGWTLSQNPFAAPLVARSAAGARAALDQAIAGTVSFGWLVPRLEAALAADDTHRIAMLTGLADDQGIALPTALRAAAEARLAEDGGLMAAAADCALCAWDITACETLSQIAACAIPLELSPVGDVSALGRAGTAWASGDEPDRLEAALAAVGLGATVATLATAGASAPVKIGATALRLSRRMGALSDRMAGAVLDAARAALGGGDGGRALTAIAADLGTIAQRTSPAETLTLLRHVDSPEDLARLARLSEVAGADTGRSIAVLGTARALRLVDRLSGLALAAIGLAGLVLAQAGALVVALLRWALSPLWRGPRHPPGPTATAAGPPRHRR